jgi:hypothetical protein
MLGMTSMLFYGTTWTTVDSLTVGQHGSGLTMDCDCDPIHITSGSAREGGGPEIKSVETHFPGGVDVPCPGPTDPTWASDKHRSTCCR